MCAPNLFCTRVSAVVTMTVGRCFLLKSYELNNYEQVMDIATFLGANSVQDHTMQFSFFSHRLRANHLHITTVHTNNDRLLHITVKLFLL